MAAKARLLQVAPSVQACYSRGWFQRLSRDDPAAAKAITKCVDEWMAGGELAEAYPTVSALYRGMVKSEMIAATIKPRRFREWINEQQARQ